MSSNRNKRNIITLIAVFLLAVIAIFSFSRVIELALVPPTPVDSAPKPSKTIVKDGVEYFPRQDITTFLVMGIDRSGPVSSSEQNYNKGEADMVALMVLDEKAGTYSILMLNRDTMMEMSTLGYTDTYGAVARCQLALSHSFGSGMLDSCENTRAAVSKFLNNIDIDHYLSMNMDTVSILTDAVGGVKVNVTDDFSGSDSTIKMGEQTLNGAQAFNFVQNRGGLGDQLNTSRMERQKSFINGFVSAFGKKLDADKSFALDTYNDVQQYVLTDCSAGTLTSVINKFADSDLNKIVSPEGENVRGEYMEFHVDEQKLQDLVLELFYEQKQL